VAGLYAVPVSLLAISARPTVPAFSVASSNGPVTGRRTRAQSPFPPCASASLKASCHRSSIARAQTAQSWPEEDPASTSNPILPESPTIELRSISMRSRPLS